MLAVESDAVKRVVDQPMGADLSVTVSHVSTPPEAHVVSALPPLRITIGDDEYAIDTEEARELRDALDAALPSDSD